MLPIVLRTFTSLDVERKIVLGFLAMIAGGTVLFLLCNAGSRPLKLVDALFTAASAVCVTGLTVLDTGKDLSPASQWVLILLIQFGGIGVMTTTAALSLVTGEKIGLRQRMFFAGGFGIETPSGVVRFLIRVLILTFSVEGAGTVVLFFGFMRTGLSPWESFRNGLFHSVSAFCNAGFSLFSDNLEGFSKSLLIPGTIMTLVVAGGLGFLVLWEVGKMISGGRQFSVHSRLVLFTTGGLVLFGTFSLALCEWNTAFGAMPPGWKLWNGLFASITPRTAGFDTVSPAVFSSAGIFVVIILMLVGASPGSTGGGMKTTTLAVLLGSTWSVLRRSTEIHLWKRKISVKILQRAVTVVVLYLFTLGIGIAALVIFEPLQFRSLVFEATSALGTVGLSLGITARLSDAGKIVLVLLMFWGRVGIVTFLYGLLKREARGTVSYPEAEIPIG